MANQFGLFKNEMLTMFQNYLGGGKLEQVGKSALSGENNEQAENVHAVEKNKGEVAVPASVLPDSSTHKSLAQRYLHFDDANDSLFSNRMDDPVNHSLFLFRKPITEPGDPQSSGKFRLYAYIFVFIERCLL